MLKNVLLTLFALVVAVAVGGGSVWYTLAAQEGVNTLHIGPWTAFPDIGTTDADPYSKARVARAGVLALGRAEGLAFVADRDSSGALLRRECTYTIEGGFPTARFWTLYAADETMSAIATGKPRPAALHSREILRGSDGGTVITAASRPNPGNWLPVPGNGALHLVLTFYDTPIASSTGLSDIALPSIREAGCHA